MWLHLLGIVVSLGRGSLVFYAYVIKGVAVLVLFVLIGIPGSFVLILSNNSDASLYLGLIPELRDAHLVIEPVLQHLGEQELVERLDLVYLVDLMVCYEIFF